MAFLQKRGAHYSICYRDPAGRSRRVSVNKLAGRKIPKKSDADAIMERWLSERNRYAPAISYTLEELFERYDRHARASFSPDTYRTEMSRLREFIMWCGDRGIVTIGQLTPLAIEDFKQGRLASGQPVTVNRYLERIRAFLNMMVNWRLASDSPFAGVQMLKAHQTERRILSDEEITRLFEVVRGDLADFVTLALQTGGRETEVSSLKWEDVKPDGIHFIKTKTYIPRRVPFAPGVGEMLDRRRKDGQVYVFQKADSPEPVSGGAWYARLRLAYARAQIDGANVHTLRHTFASRLVRSGVNIAVLQKLMGHVNIQTTLRYIHLYSGDTEAAVSGLNLPPRS